MARKKPAADATTPQTEGQDANPAAETAPRAEPSQDVPLENSTAPVIPNPGEPHRSKWLPRFNSWGDYEAGVAVIEDRENRRMTLKFDGKPSEAVREVMKSERYGYKYDTEKQLWYKKFQSATGRQARNEADQLAFTVANMIRQEKGLEPKAAFHIGM